MQLLDKKMRSACAARGMKFTDADVAYGVVNGCFITIAPEVLTGAYVCLDVKVYVGKVETEDEQRERANTVKDTVLSYAETHAKTCKLLPKRAGVASVDMMDEGRTVCIRFARMKAERLFAVLDELLPTLAPVCLYQRCACCGQTAEEENPLRPVLVDGITVLPCHEACAEKTFFAAEEQGTQAIDAAPKGSVVTGLVGALLGGLLGAVVWAIVGIFGYVASIVGMLIAFLAGKGYDLMHGRQGKAKVAVLIVCVVLAVALGNCAMYVYQMNDNYDASMEATYEYLLEQAADDYPLALRAQVLEQLREANPKEETINAIKADYSRAAYLRDMAQELLSDSEFLTEAAGNLFMGLFFAFLGCFGMLRMASGKAKNVVKPQRLQGRL